MSYLLDSSTLPNPVEFTRETVEASTQNVTIEGKDKKDIVNRKERYILEFTKLTQAQISSIMAKYNLQTTLSFQVTETNLTINATDVHIDIPQRAYNTGGDQYREDITLILTEVL